MDLVKRAITVVLTIFTFLGASAQDLLQMVPKESTYVGMIDANQIKNKGRLAEMMELPFMQTFDKEIAKEFSRSWVKSDTGPYLDLSKHGVNTSGKAYSYFVMGKEMLYGGMLIPITDQEKFKSFVKIITKDPEGENIITLDGYTATSKRDLHITWNQNTALFLGVEINPFYKDSIDKMLRKKHNYGYSHDYGLEKEEIAVEETEETEIGLEEEAVEEEEIVVEETEETEIGIEEEAVEEEETVLVRVEEIRFDEEVVEEAEPEKEMTWSEFYDIKQAYRDSIEQVWIEKNLLKLINSRGTNSYASNTEFVNYIKSTPEMAVVFDYSLLKNYLAAPFLASLSRPFRRNQVLPYLMSFYGDIMIFAKVEFKQDAAELSIDTKYGKRIGEVLDNVKKKKISKKFLKYLNKDLMGYYAMGMDVEGVGEGMKKMLKKSLPEIPEYGKAAVNGIEIMETLLDEKAIYNMFTGDAVVAVNGIQEFDVEYKTYDYDEDFNRTEITDTIQKKLPEVIFMAEVGNKTDVQKIINLLVNLKVFKQEGNFYSLDIKRNDIPVYMRIYNDILFIGNNKEFIKKPVELDKSKQLSKDHKEMFRKNTIAGFVNFAKIMRYFADEEKNSFKVQKMLVETSNLLDNIKMTGYKKDNYLHGKYSVNLKKSDDNSLVDIIKYINQMYLIDQKRM